MSNWWEFQTPQRQRNTQATLFRQEVEPQLFRAEAQVIQKPLEQQLAQQQEALRFRQDADEIKQGSGGFLGKLGGGVSWTFRQLQRPNHAIASFADETVKMYQGKDAENPFIAAGKGLVGSRQTTFADVLNTAGVDNKLARGILGFGMDVLLDPTTYVGFGVGRAASLTLADGTRVLLNKEGQKVIQKAIVEAGGAADKLGQRLTEDVARTAVEQALRKTGDIGKYVEKGGVHFDFPVVGRKYLAESGSTALAPARKLGSIIEELPGIRAARGEIGRLFVSYPRLKAAGYNDLAEEFLMQKRMPHLVEKEARSKFNELFGHLDDTQQLQLFALSEHDFDKMGHLERADLFQKYNVAPPDGATVATLEDEGLKSAYEMYKGEWRPYYDALALKAGVNTLTDNYVAAVYPQTFEKQGFGLKRVLRVGKVGAAETRKYRTTETQLEAGRIFSFETSLLNEKKKALQASVNDFVKRTMEQYGVKGAAEAQTGMVAFDAGKGLGTYFVPPEIAESMTRFLSPNQTVGVLKVFDTLQGIWKASVTSVFPAFHVRNAIGNTYLNWLGGIYNPADYLKAADMMRGKEGFLRTLEGDLSHTQLLAEAEKRGVRGFAGVAELDIDPNSPTQKLIKWGFIPNPFGIGRYVGEAIEDNAKLAHFVGKVRQGFSLDEAATSAKRFLFDYGDLSDTERTVFRRIVPFYTFLRKNVGLHFEQIAKQPGKIAALPKGAMAFEETTGVGLNDAERALMPNWVAEQLSLAFGRDSEGKIRIMYGTGLPIEQLNYLWEGSPMRTMEKLFGQASPLIRTPLEIFANKSTFTGRAIDDPSYQNMFREANSWFAKVPGLSQWLQIQTQEVTDPKTGKVRTLYNCDPTRMFLLSAVLGRFVSTAKTVQQTTTTEGGWGKLAEILPVVTGVKTSEIDLARSTGFGSVKRTAIFDQANSQLDVAAQHLIDGDIKPQDYLDFRGDVFQDRRTRLDQLEEDSVNLPSEDREALRRTLLAPAEQKYLDYQEIQPEIGVNGLPDFDTYYTQRDAIEATLTSEEQAYFTERRKQATVDMPPALRAVEQEYREDVELMRPYWKISDTAWAIVQRQMPRIANIGSPAELDLAVARGWLMTGQAKAAEKLYNKLSTQAKERYLRLNPEVDAALLRWGYREISQTGTARQLVTPIGG